MFDYNALPIFLGTDENSYGAARMYHEATGKKAIIYGAAQLSPTSHSKYCDVTVVSKFNKSNHFLDGLADIKKRFADHEGPIILLGMGDAYPPMLAKYADQLKDDFIIPYVSEPEIEALVHKNSFYQVAAQNGLSVPETTTVGQKDIQDIDSPYGYPVVLKANDSVKWYSIDFFGRAKVYIIKNRRKLRKILMKSYKNGYTGDFSLQEYLTGVNVEHTMTAYVDQNRKVRAMALGQSVMEDITPWGIGNHNAIMPVFNQELYDQMAKFLKNISYVGFANIDFTYDEKTKTYKAFEMNVRMGRSSYWAELNGVNWIEQLLIDYSTNAEFKNDEILYSAKGEEDGKIWLQVLPKLFKKHAKKSPQKEIALRMINNKQYGHGYKDEEDNSKERQAINKNIEKGYKMNYLRYGWQFWR